MSLFKQKTEQPQQTFDPVAFRQQMLQEMQQLVQQAMQPILTGMQALNQRAAAQPQNDDEDEQQPNRQLTIQDIEQVIDRRFGQKVPEVTRNYMPRDRQMAERSFMRQLTPKGREMYDKYADEVDTLINSMAPELQGNPDSYARAFEFAMLQNHKNEYLQAHIEDMKPEELPPHLQPPGGAQSVPPAEEIKLSKEEEVMQPIFDRTYKKGFSKKEMSEWAKVGELGADTMEQMIAIAREKGLYGSGTAGQGNNQASEA